MNSLQDNKMELFVFLEEYRDAVALEEILADRLKCIICSKLLIDAVQNECGCKFCRSCIIVYISGKKTTCPSKLEDCEGYEISELSIRQDNATNREISRLKAKCPFNECKTTTTFILLVSHVRTCDYRTVKCEKCDEQLPFNEMSNHLDKQCPHRTQDCPFCKISMTSIELNTNHLNPDSNGLCGEYFDECPNKCEMKGKVLLKEHLKSCLNKKLECPFHEFGCEIGKLPKRKLVEHMDTFQYEHLSRLVNKLLELRKMVQYVSEELSKEKKQILKGIEENEKMTQEIINIQNLIKDKKFLQAPIRPNPISHTQTLLFRTGSYIWKITEYSMKKSDAQRGTNVSIMSEPFLTSEFGYQMCLKVYPDGDGIGKGSHLSVFFAIMKGPYDDILSWPFRQKVTLSILDQLNVSKSRSDSFKPDTNSSCYQKPTESINIASGAPKFIAQSMLLASDFAYCRNDAIFLKMSVEQLNMNKS